MTNGEDGDALAGTPVYCSWSGGKDCASALRRAVRRGARPELLITMMTEGGERSRSHGLHRSLLAAQAAAMGVPIRFVAATWDDYEAAFEQAVRAAVGEGLRTGVFGDMDTEHHREWVRSVTARVGSAASLPLWQCSRDELLREGLDAGQRAVVVAVRDGTLPTTVLGRTVDGPTVDLFRAAGIDIAGENGEYHTFVTAGPLFREPVEVRPGPLSLRDGVWFTDLRPAHGPDGTG